MEAIILGNFRSRGRRSVVAIVFSRFLVDIFVGSVVSFKKIGVVLAAVAVIVVALGSVDVGVANWSVSGHGDGRCSVQARY